MTQLDNIEQDVHQIKADVRELKERVLTLEITNRVERNQRTLRIQWILIIATFIGISITLGKLLI